MVQKISLLLVLSLLVLSLGSNCFALPTQEDVQQLQQYGINLRAELQEECDDSVAAIWEAFNIISMYYQGGTQGITFTTEQKAILKQRLLNLAPLIPDSDFRTKAQWFITEWSQ